MKYAFEPLNCSKFGRSFSSLVSPAVIATHLILSLTEEISTVKGPMLERIQFRMHGEFCVDYLLNCVICPLTGTKD